MELLISNDKISIFNFSIKWSSWNCIETQKSWMSCYMNYNQSYREKSARRLIIWYTRIARKSVPVIKYIDYRVASS